MLSTITRLKVPNVILRYIMINFLDIKSIETLLLTVQQMNVLDSYSKDLVMKSKKGFAWMFTPPRDTLVPERAGRDGSDSLPISNNHLATSI